MHPAVLHALMEVVNGVQPLGREVSICGEMAGNPLAAVLLLGMGVNSLSMGAGNLLPVKAVIRSFTRDESQDLLRQALEYESADSVRGLLVAALEAKNLGGLVRPGK